MLLNRTILPSLRHTLTHVPAVALLGTRQIGKTTLAQMIAQERPSLYLDLESPDDLFKLSDPISYLSQHQDKLVILDEMQRYPDLFPVLRGLIDTNRQMGKRGEQLLLLGSASMDLLQQSSESLAGRIHYLSMSGLNVLELPDSTQTQQQQLWLRGGFPNSYLADSNRMSMEWLEMFIRTYLERDVPQFGFRVPSARLQRLWTMLAHLQGETVNHSKLAANLEIDGKTVHSYIDILVDLLLVRRLEPWHTNAKKRLVKSPRYYIRDSGLLHRLLGITDFDSLLSHPVMGKSWEGFVLENIYAVLPLGVQAYYYRTASGMELDLVLCLSDNSKWAIEIKHGKNPSVSRGFHQAAHDIGASHKLVIYSGDEQFPLGENTTVVSLKHLLHLLQTLS